eukprot:1062924-Rhodomonas_salina.1
MFQVCTGDGWATDVVRPMFGEDEGALPDGSVPTFFPLLQSLDWLVSPCLLALPSVGQMYSRRGPVKSGKARLTGPENIRFESREDGCASVIRGEACDTRQSQM